MTEQNKIIAYKGFNKDLKCRDFQYEVGKEYEINGEIECCKRGFHACKSPMEVWDHYDMLNSRFAEVELSGKIKEEENSTKVCSSCIKIKAELKLADIINIGIEWLKYITSPSKIKADCALNDNKESRKQIGSSGYSAQIGSSGYSAQIGSSGYSAQIGSSGDYAQIGSSGDYAKIGSSGDYAKIGSSGYSAKIGSSGDSAQIDSVGEDSVIMCAGNNSIAKAKVGSWITLSEWRWDETKRCNIPICVKTEFIDGEKIKPDTWYKLIDGEFEEVQPWQS